MNEERSKQLQPDVHAYRRHFDSDSSLPEVGRSREEILAELAEMKGARAGERSFASA